MASAPVVAPKQSWLSKLGQDIVKVLGIVTGVEKVAEPVVEALLPASTVAFGIFDKIVQLVTNIEGAYAAVGQQASGTAKLGAAVPYVESLLDQYVTDNFPGSADILKAETYLAQRAPVAESYVNLVVQFLNSLPASSQTAVTTSAIAAAAAAKSIKA